MFPCCRKSIKMWVMLSVIFSIPGTVSDFERLSDKAPKPSVVGRGCKLVFSNSIKTAPVFFLPPHSHLVLIRFLPVCVSDEMNVLPLFLVWTCQLINTSYGNFLSVSLFLCLVSKQKHIRNQKNLKKPVGIYSILTTCLA